MDNFVYWNPVRIVFGKGAIADLSNLVPAGSKVMMIYGGGSIKANGVYDQTKTALKNFSLAEFGGIEPNPTFETCMKAVNLGRKKAVNFLLAVGGGSVLDGTKFIAAAIPFKDADPWNILSEWGPVKHAVPFGAVLTLPATGSEMNNASVISRVSTQEKLFFTSDLVYPVFSIMDPTTTFSLPPRQVANGIVDTFVHVMEQYMTRPTEAPLQDRQAEAVLLTLIEEAPKVRSSPDDYAARANLMWCATQALNGIIGVGVPQDWATHMIGHELTAFYGIDHAQSLAVVLPGVMAYRMQQKSAKLVQYVRRVWGLKITDPKRAAKRAIQETEEFFESVGVPTRLSAYGIEAADAAEKIRARFDARGTRLGEDEDLTPQQVAEILLSRK